MALNNLTPQEIEEFGKMWGDVLLSTFSPEEISCSTQEKFIIYGMILS